MKKLKKLSFFIFYLLLKNLPGNIYINRLRGKIIGLYVQGTRKNFQIGRAVNIPHPESLFVGDNVVINAEVYLISSASTITIGDNCLVAPRCFIQTLNHKYDNKQLLIREQGSQSDSVVIEADCWLAVNTVILPGVSIRRGCVIGASAVVTKDTEPYGIYVGIPAKKINTRK